MKFTIKTPVPGNYKVVMNAFDKKLFEHLKPVGASMEIVKFTGSKEGDIVHIRFTSPIKAEWISKIVEDGVDDERAYFIDQGTKLPWPLKYWKHEHVVAKIGEKKSQIEDRITYKTFSIVLDALIRPAMYMAFYPRRAQYQKYFK
ncbi:SRPBCC family protein [Portibacter marinus]|uniref:hypothetical protein n=1 Tax=Portibacter marinus TaxID=2898660 RepID=UPI001F2122F9|nr:hypothetical protein [Portibacter marinus]